MKQHKYQGQVFLVEEIQEGGGLGSLSVQFGTLGGHIAVDADEDTPFIVFVADEKRTEFEGDAPTALDRLCALLLETHERNLRARRNWRQLHDLFQGLPNAEEGGGKQG